MSSRTTFTLSAGIGRSSGPITVAFTIPGGTVATAFGGCSGRRWTRAGADADSPPRAVNTTATPCS